MKILAITCSFAALIGFGCESDDNSRSSRSPASPPQQESRPKLKTRRDVVAERGIRKCFESYMAATLNEDGEIAVDYVSVATLDYFQRIMDHVRKMSRIDVERLPMSSRYLVLAFRHRIPRDQALIYTGRDALIHAINNGWISKDGVATAELTDVHVEGRFATAGVRIKNKDNPHRYHFSEHDGIWKFDLEPMMKVMNAAVSALARESNVSENEMLILMLDAVSEKTTDDSVWQPLIAEDEGE